MLSRVIAPSVRSISTSSSLMRIVPGSLEDQECAYPIAGKKTHFTDLKNAFNGIKSGKWGILWIDCAESIV